MRPPPDARGGFMLVEVLAALVVTAALVATVLPFAGQLVAHWQAGQAAVVQADGWMQAVARLSDDVAEAMPIREPGNPAALAFAVGPKGIDIVRPALGGSRADRLERVSYQVVPAAGGEALVRHARPMTGSGSESAVALFDGPYSFRFAAIARDGARSTVWTDGKSLPLRLELVVAATGGGRVPFSPLPLPIAARSNPAAVVPLLRQTPP